MTLLKEERIGEQNIKLRKEMFSKGTYMHYIRVATVSFTVSGNKEDYHCGLCSTLGFPQRCPVGYARPPPLTRRALRSLTHWIIQHKHCIPAYHGFPTVFKK